MTAVAPPGVQDIQVAAVAVLVQLVKPQLHRQWGVMAVLALHLLSQEHQHTMLAAEEEAYHNPGQADLVDLAEVAMALALAQEHLQQALQIPAAVVLELEQPAQDQAVAPA
jgi:hypothetical protein